MKTSSRALIGFGIGIAALVIITIILVLTLGRGQPTLLAENTPEGVVQRFMLAAQEKNYSAAYGYLAPEATNEKGSPSPVRTYENWLQSAQFTGDSTWKANLGKVNITGDSASVNVIIDHFRPGGPFSNPVSSSNITFFLKKVGTNWLIVSPADLYWVY